MDCFAARLAAPRRLPGFSMLLGFSRTLPGSFFFAAQLLSSVARDLSATARLLSAAVGLLSDTTRLVYTADWLLFVVISSLCCSASFCY